MAKAFSVASWNVEHFKNDSNRIERVVNFLKDQNPDVFALYEVESGDVFSALVTLMPGYHFHITEGEQSQEILVGAKKSLTSFFTQKLEFKSGNTYLRPGALLTVTIDGKHYQVLFLHTKSSDQPVGLGIRDDMFSRAIDFKKTLEKKGAAIGQPGPANYLFLGDLNTMGMEYRYKKAAKDKDIPADLELTKLDHDAQKVGMKRLPKSQPFTWWNGPQSSLPPSNLDHVVAASHLQFKTINGAEVDVRGWASLNSDSEKGKWIKNFSDHSLLFFQVEKV